ncbi:hypothetical protein V5F29_19225 [Xanthobacter aminoxidans]|uniref:hypothetical protein n=1 Tax=Xanthobacter aminoxidans TaxID=186280 RepID=UPI003726AB17
MRIGAKHIAILTASLLLIDNARTGGIFPSPLYCAIGDGIMLGTRKFGEPSQGGLNSELETVFAMQVLAAGVFSGRMSAEEFQAIQEGRQPYCFKVASLLKYGVAKALNTPMSGGWGLFDSK